MNLLNLILTSISLILSIISDIIAIQSKRKIEKINQNSKIEIRHITTEMKSIEIKSG